MKHQNYSRKFTIITYLDNDILLSYLKSQSNISHYAFILHDKDNKKIHTHLVIRYINARSKKSVENEFTEIDGQNVFVEVLNDKNAMIDYFTHKNEKDKHKYSLSEIKSNCLDFWLDDNSTESGEVALDIIESLRKGTPILDMVSRYGRDFVIHYNQYRLIADIATSQSFEKIKNKSRLVHIAQKIDKPKSFFD